MTHNNTNTTSIVVVIHNATQKTLLLSYWASGLHTHFRIQPPTTIAPQCSAMCGTDHHDTRLSGGARVAYGEAALSGSGSGCAGTTGCGSAVVEKSVVVLDWDASLFRKLEASSSIGSSAGGDGVCCMGLGSASTSMSGGDGVDGCGEGGCGEGGEGSISSGGSDFFFVEVLCKENYLNFVFNPSTVNNRDALLNPFTRTELEKALEKTEDETFKATLTPRLTKLKALEAQFYSQKVTLTFKVVALSNYKTKETGFLDLRIGDVINVLDNTNPIWWYGDLNGKLGYFPAHIAYGGNIKLGPEHPPIHKEDTSDEPIAVIANTDYEGCENELTYKKGNIILTLDCDPNQEWWEGVLDKKSGYFLKANVTPLDRKQPNTTAEIKRSKSSSLNLEFQNSKERRALVMHPFKSTSSDELPLIKGAIVVVLDCSPSQDWWEGVLGNKYGFFPKSHVDLLGPLENVKSKLREATVLFDFESKGENELSLKRGTTVYIRDIDCSDQSVEWWEGCISDGSHGFFPSSFVQLNKTQDLKSAQSFHSTSSLGPLSLPGGGGSGGVSILRPDSPSNRKLKRLSRGKPNRRDSLKFDELKKVANTLVDRMSDTAKSHPEEKNLNLQLQRLNAELSNQKLRNRHLDIELREMSEKLVPSLTAENSLLKKEIAWLKESEAKLKLDLLDMHKLALALKDANSLVELEEERTIALKQFQEILINEVSNLKSNLIPTVTQDNTKETQDIITQLKEALKKEVKRTEELQNNLMEVTTNIRLNEIETEEKKKLVDKLEETEMELNSLNMSYANVMKMSEEWEHKYKATEQRNEELLRKSETKQTELENELENWKMKCHYFEDKLETKKSKLLNQKQKLNFEIQRSAMLESKIRQLDDQTQRDSQTIDQLKEHIVKLQKELEEKNTKETLKRELPTARQKPDHNNNNTAATATSTPSTPTTAIIPTTTTITSIATTGSMVTIKVPDREFHDYATDIREKMLKLEEKRLLDDEVDEETQNSFRRAQKFFAARAIVSPIPLPETFNNPPKKEKKQKH